MTSGILNRIVGSVFHHLRNSDETEQRQKCNQPVARKSNHGQNEQCTTNSNGLEDSRHEEELKEHSKQIHPTEETAIESADDLGFLRCRSPSRCNQPVCFLNDKLAQDEFPSRVDHVHNQH